MIYLKASKPVGLSKYEVTNNIEDEPEFKWRVKTFMHKQDLIISKGKSKYWITTHKYGIQVPKTVEKSYKIDHQTRTTFWKKTFER